MRRRRATRRMLDKKMVLLSWSVCCVKAPGQYDIDRADKNDQNRVGMTRRKAQRHFGAVAAEARSQP